MRFSLYRERRNSGGPIHPVHPSVPSIVQKWGWFCRAGRGDPGGAGRVDLGGPGDPPGVEHGVSAGRGIRGIMSSL